MEKYIVKLSKGEQEFLSAKIKKGKSSAKLTMHARILLACHESENKCFQTDTEISKRLYVSAKTIQRVRKTCVLEGIEAALSRKPHSAYRPRKIQGDEEAHLIALSCSAAPKGRQRWTLKLLAQKMVELEIIDKVSERTIGRDLKRVSLKPWQKKEWCIPEASAEFVCKMEDVLDVYKRPYDEKKPVICLDEMSKQLTKEIRPAISMMPGKSERYDTEYERNGTCNLFIAGEPLKGKRIVEVTEQRKKTDFALFIKNLVDGKYKDAEKIVLVMDNLNTHNGSSFYETFEPKEAKRILDKLEIHYTPKHGSWLNVAEIELSHLSRQCLNRRLPDKKTLQREVLAWKQQRNSENSIVDWQFTVDKARGKLKHLYPAINPSSVGHNL